MDLMSLIQALEESWDAKSAFDATEWSEENPARGQCAVSSLIVQDYMGGEIVRFAVDPPAGGGGKQEKHFVNMIDGDLFDTTISQYSERVEFEPSPPDLSQFGSVREKLLADEDTKRRYEYLKDKVAQRLI